MDAELNKAKNEIKRLKDYRSEITIQLNNINGNSLSAKDRLERTKVTAKALESYISENINKEIVEWMGIGEYNRLMSRLKNPTSKKM